MCRSLSLESRVVEHDQEGTRPQPQSPDVLRRTEPDHSGIHIIGLVYLPVIMVGLDSFRIPESSWRHPRTVLFTLKGTLTFTLKAWFPTFLQLLNSLLIMLFHEKVPIFLGQIICKQAFGQIQLESTNTNTDV